jgi:predicted nucleic acid-binding protein
VIVVDASAAVDYLTPCEPQASWVSDLLFRHEGDLHAPHLLDMEVTSAIRRRVSAGVLSAAAGGAIVSDLADLGLRRYPHVALLERVWELRNVLTVHDAAYVALAEALDCPLVTTDRALGRAASHRVRVEAFPS